MRPGRLLKPLLVLGFLYLFLVSIGLMGASFKYFGAGFAEKLLTMTANPLVSLFIGMLVTAIIQSSSTTTSLIVALVSGGCLTVENAVPMVMGANIGTTVTNTIVSLVQIGRREEFSRAFPAAIVHDLFNLMAVLLFLPLQLATGFLSKTASALADLLAGGPEVSLFSPLKMAIKPVTRWVVAVVDANVESAVLAGAVLMTGSFVLLFLSLWRLVETMRSVAAGRAQVVFNEVVGRAPVLGIVAGAVFTMIVQSSSVTTSIMVPLAGAGIVGLAAVFPITLGANIGTTITALLASVAGTKAGLTIALVHCLFNVLGVLVIFPFRPVRAIPVALAQKIGRHVSEHRTLAIPYILAFFFVIPLAAILMSLM